MDFDQRPAWKKSTRSTNSHACVEVAVTSDVVGVRDTKNRAGGRLMFSRDEWAAFVDGLKRQ